VSSFQRVVREEERNQTFVLLIDQLYQNVASLVRSSVIPEDDSVTYTSAIVVSQNGFQAARQSREIGPSYFTT